MTDYYTIHPIDCRAAMQFMPDNGVDSVVCDPPYGLSQEPDAAEVLRHWLAGDDYVHSGGGFMGRSWDSFVPGPSVWREALRVLKPGGHLLAFFGTRTYDLGCMAIRLAGFEIRDEIAWIYGSGFPKSLDIAKSIEGAKNGKGARFSSRDEGLTTSASTHAEPGAQWKDSSRRTMADKTDSGWSGGTVHVTHPDALQWQGFGTALKPAHEPIVVARKPLGERTVAANVLTHGTGGLNIDGCRIGTDEHITNHSRGAESAISKGKYGDSTAQDTHQTAGQQLGRFPANVIHDGSDEVLACFPNASGQIVDASTSDTPRSRTVYGEMKRGRGDEASADSENDGSVGFKMRPGDRRLDSGSAARFFYATKASRADRNAGLDGFPESMPRAANGSINAVSENRGSLSKPRANYHPTVKPTDLMRYLCRLVTPPGGTVLDPFAGSGSTGKAAILEGFYPVLCEMTPEYLPIIEARLDDAVKQRYGSQS